MFTLAPLRLFLNAQFDSLEQECRIFLSLQMRVIGGNDRRELMTQEDEIRWLSKTWICLDWQGRNALCR